MNDSISNQRLSFVNPALALKVNTAANLLALQGTYLRVTQGLRTYAQQDALFAQGRTEPGHIVTNAKGGYSNHNFGCAVDVVPFLSGSVGELNWNTKSDQFMAMVGYLKAQGLAWGGDWQGNLADYDHFQLANVPVTPSDTDRQAFAQGGLQAVWDLYPQP